eukprot:877172-Pyramimonas_sp.AAC.2
MRTINFQNSPKQVLVSRDGRASSAPSALPAPATTSARHAAVSGCGASVRSPSGTTRLAARSCPARRSRSHPTRSPWTL